MIRRKHNANFIYFTFVFNVEAAFYFAKMKKKMCLCSDNKTQIKKPGFMRKRAESEMRYVVHKKLRILLMETL